MIDIIDARLIKEYWKRALKEPSSKKEKVAISIEDHKNKIIKSINAGIRTAANSLNPIYYRVFDTTDLTYDGTLEFRNELKKELSQSRYSEERYSISVFTYYRDKGDKDRRVGMLFFINLAP